MKLVNHLSDLRFQIIPIKIENDQINCIDARELWQNLRSKTRFNDWITRRLAETQAEEGEDYFYSNLSKSPTIGNLSQDKVGRPRIDYLLSFDLVKEFAMLEHNEIGKRVRKYFIEIEKSFKFSTLLHKDTSELLNLLNIKYQTPGSNAIFEEIKKLERKRNAKCSRVVEYAYKEYYKNGRVKIETEILLDYDRDIYLGKD